MNCPENCMTLMTNDAFQNIYLGNAAIVGSAPSKTVVEGNEGEDC